jgi:hypothetical protein
LGRAETLVTSTGQRFIDDRLIRLQRITHAWRNRVFRPQADFLEGR